MASAQTQARVLIVLEAVAKLERGGLPATASEIAFVLATIGHNELLNSVRERLCTTARQAGLLACRSGVWSLTEAGWAALAEGRVDLA